MTLHSSYATKMTCGIQLTTLLSFSPSCPEARLFTMALPAALISET